ncbi:DUF6538 domain-containing protein [Falsiroseomonas sp.]|uniref:DUF6538 domain-containing protein n=1 Tax=Falsiroseomonas sp. TaxID=2870721 RepID=UPI0035648B86
MGQTAPSYLITRNRYHSIRFRVPVGLIPRLGRQEIVRALGTADGRAARVIAARIVVRLDRLWKLMRDRLTLTSAALKKLADDWLRQEVDREWAIFQSGDFSRAALPEDFTPEQAQRANAELFAQDAWLTELALLETHPTARPHVMDDLAGIVLAEAGQGERRGSRERATLSLMLLERRIDLQRSKVAWAEGDPAALPPSSWMEKMVRVSSARPLSPTRAGTQWRG